MNEQLEGQMNIFDFIPEPGPEDEWSLPCDTCKFDVKGCCSYDMPLGDFCRLGDKWQPKECKFSGHTCNKKELWKVADTLDEIMCPHVCCRKCNTRLCGARCNGSEEPKPKDAQDDYILRNPSCFYVFGHYLDRDSGWHKMPEELPTFGSWTLVDVVLFGKKSGTAWMEHEKWEAQYWAFRSVDDRGNSESTEVLAWKISEEKQ